MARFDQQTLALLNAFDDPAMIVEGEVVQVANEPAKSLLGRGIEGKDVRLAVRQPQALDFVLGGSTGDIDFTGVGAVGRPWQLQVRRVGNSALLLRLIDRSAAHAAEKMRVDFVANASHELRTPLTTVLGYAESLEDGDLDAEMAAKFAGIIRTEAKRMLRIIEDLMSLSRIEADRFVPPSGKVAIASVLRNAVENIRSAAQDRGCDLHLDLQEDLPEIAADFTQLVQVADNLLSNAVRYGCSAESCKIRVTAAIDSGVVRIDVTDNGPGIAREHLPFLTRRFYRVDEARSRETGGTGLGLAIVKHIVERHRGSLEIDSRPAKGTTVTIRLPAG